MANKPKIGLTYFPFDTSFFADIRVRKLIKYQSGKAITVYINLLCDIYKNGYHLKWDKELPFVLSESTGLDEAFINEVIKCCLTIGLFSEKMFSEKQVLTSKGIQERYTLICKQTKRSVNISEFLIINSEEMPIDTEEIPINSEDYPQRKEKKRKVKQIKEKKIEVPALSDFLEYCKKQIPEDYEALLFSLKAKYQAWFENDWNDGNDNKINNWKTKILNTIPYLKKEKSSGKKESILKPIIESRNEAHERIKARHANEQ